MYKLSIDIIDPRNNEERARYDRLFEQCPDAYIQQSSLWADIISDLGPDIPVFLIAHDAGRDLAAFPLYLFESPHGAILTSVPQPGALGGIFVRPEVAQEEYGNIYDAMLSSSLDMARERECLVCSVITNPIHDDIEHYQRGMTPDYIFENFTQYIDIGEFFDGDRVTLRNYNRRSNLSRNIKHSRSFGFNVELCTEREDFLKWYEVHKKRHAELGAVPLSIDLFSRMFHVLVPQKKAGLLLVKDGSRVCSGSFFVYHKNVMDVYMLSMDSEYSGTKCNYLCVDHSLRWARDLGIKYYNWQSSSSIDSGVYRFKEQWGSVRSTYCYATKKLDGEQRIRDLGREGISEHYPWHYVVPFGVFEAGFDKKTFKKEGL
jgi:hypothetical protein